jgi:hypothetical protein
MSTSAICPDWPALVARRDGGDEPPEWRDALVHLDACGDCRDAALAADPTLVFRRLRHAAVEPAADVDSMRQAVAALRRASRVTAVEAGVEPVSARRRAVGHRLRQAAAALLLAAAGFGAWFVGQDQPGYPAAQSAVAASVAEPWSASPVTTAARAPRSAEELASRPVFEGLSTPRTADVYQLGEEDLLVVMVVDETLDI